MSTEAIRIRYEVVLSADREGAVYLWRNQTRRIEDLPNELNGIEARCGSIATRRDTAAQAV